MDSGSSDRHAPHEGRFKLRSRDEIHAAERQVLEALEQFGYDQSACFAVRTAMEEALANALLHGNANDPARSITLEYQADGREITIDVQDEGRGFDPRTVPDPTRPENIDIPSGRGIMLMRVYMTDVEFVEPGNRVRLRYVRQ